MDENTKALSKWKKAKRISDRNNNFEASNKLNKFMGTKNIKDKLSILDDSISLLEKEKNANEDNNLQQFKDILGSESFFKQEGKAQVIGLEDTKDGRGLYERLEIYENDDMKNYQVFKLLTNKTEEQETKKENKEGFNSIHSILKDAKYFQVPEKINLMLLNTKNRVSKIKLPHLFMFLDTTIVIYDRIYYGILLGDITQLKEMVERGKINNEEIKDLEDNIIIQTFYEEGRKVGWNKFNLYDKKVNKYVRKLQEYVMNILCFLNSEDIKIIFRERTEKNKQRRKSNNKIPIPSFNKIEVVGYLKKYLDKLESSGGGGNLTHKFWVRGHFRHFWNKKYDNLYKSYKNGELKGMEGKQYMMDGSGALKLWIYPYVKGQGILINKSYELS